VTAGGIGRVRVVAGVARRGDCILLTQRPADASHGGMWEFPGGKIERDETPRAALEREVREELGVACRAGAVLDVVRHDYPSGLAVEIVFLECALDSESFTPSRAVHDTRWVRPSEVALDQVLEADRPFLARGAGREEPRKGESAPAPRRSGEC
jgi:8-oxo-dGTP diphosphatase